ncbi:ATP-binding protein [Micromonospora sp. NPDC004704]
MVDEVLFGRESEQARLTGELDRAPATGGALVLRGEAGVGKSSLLAATTSQAARRGMRILTTTGVQAEIEVPFAGLHRLLRTVLDGEREPAARDTVLAAVGMVDAPVGQPFRVALAVLDLLTTTTAAGQPVLLAVEDAQWLDRPSWDVLTFVARRLTSDPVVLVMAMRDGAECERRLASAGLPELRVEPLAEEPAVALLAYRAPGLSPALRARVLSEAGGNPLGLVELAVVAARFGPDALLPASLPLTARVERTFTALVGELPPATRTLLLVAALDDGDGLDEILGATAGLETTPVTVADVQAAVTAGLVEVDDGFRIRFRHPLVRSAVRQAAGVARRRQVHAALAGQLAGQDDRRVRHRAAATIGADEQVARDLTAAADRAARRGAVASALTTMERAAQLSEDARERSDRLLRAAGYAVDLGDHPSVVRLVRDVEEQYLQPTDQARLSWLREAFLGGGWSGAAPLPAFVDIVDLMRRNGDTELALHSLVTLSVRSWWSNPDEQTRGMLLAAAERLDVPALDPRLVNVLAGIAPIERGAEALDRLSVLMRRMDSDPGDLFLLGNAANAVGALGLATTFLASSVAGLRSQGRLGLLAVTLVNQAWTAAQLADIRLGLTAATEGRALSLETGQPRWAMTADLNRAHVEALRGNGETARELADEVERLLLPGGASPILGMVQLTRGVEALAAGRDADAYRHLYRIFDPADGAYHQYLRFSAFGHLADAGTRSGHHDQVAAILRTLQPIVAATRSPILRVTVAYAEAVLSAGADADGDAGTDEVFRARLGTDLSGWPFERARLQLAYGGWLRRRRRVAESRPLLREACAVFDALGVVPWADRARRELRAAGEASRRPVDWQSLLTPQELQIAELAATGLSNPEIAERLFLSRRTVSTHLYRIYPKMGISSRGELGRAMFAPGERDDTPSDTPS